MADRRRAMLELRLLCQPGVGIASIAPELCRLIRDIVPSDSGAVAWVDEAGMPVGFFHEQQPPALKELFANDYQSLFMGPGEFGVAWMLGQRRTTIGNWMGAPGAEVERSNTYNLYMRPLGHRHLLEARVEVDGRPRALFTFYREARWPFDDADVARFRLIEPLLQRAASDAPVAWTNDGRPDEYLIVDATGRRLLAQSGGAGTLLQDATFIGQGVSLVGGLSEPPVFVRQVAEGVARGEPGVIALPVAAGMLNARATALTGLGHEGRAEPQLLVTLGFSRPKSVQVLRPVLDLHLSPLRSEIAQFAASGGRRLDAPRHLGISKAALKKHLAEIYRASGAREWDEIGPVLTASV